jgi:hypothetical protein
MLKRDEIKEDITTHLPLLRYAPLWKKSLWNPLGHLVGIVSGTLLPQNMSHKRIIND